jgi:hypothetical protein
MVCEIIRMINIETEIPISISSPVLGMVLASSASPSTQLSAADKTLYTESGAGYRQYIEAREGDASITFVYSR